MPGMTFFRKFQGYQAANTEEPLEEEKGKPGQRRRRSRNSSDIGCRASLSKFWRWRSLISRDRFFGALACNALAFLFPATLPTLSKTWIPQTDTSHVATNDSFQYLDVIARLLNEGLPRAAWVVIGDASLRTYSERIRLTNTLILFQLITSFLAFAVFAMPAGKFVTQGLTPENTGRTLLYIRTIAFAMVPSAIETALAVSCRALNRPNIPLLISFTNYILNILLGMLLSATLPQEKWGADASLTTQARLTLLCNTLSLLVGLAYYTYTAVFRSPYLLPDERIRPTRKALRAVWRPAWGSILESLLRNLLAIFVAHSIGPMRLLNRTSWLVFNDLRWNLIMAPTRALEATVLTHVAHNWSQLRAQAGSAATRVKVSWGRIRLITQPARAAVGLNLLVEIPVGIFMGLWAMQHYAAWATSNTSDIGRAAGQMWRNSEWCYILYVVSVQAAAVLLVTKPRWWFGVSVAPQLLWVLPWALACRGKDIDQVQARFYYESVFAGSLVFGAAWVAVGVAGWVWCLRRGTMRFDQFLAA